MRSFDYSKTTRRDGCSNCFFSSVFVEGLDNIGCIETFAPFGRRKNEIRNPRLLIVISNLRFEKSSKIASKMLYNSYDRTFYRVYAFSKNRLVAQTQN